MKRSLCLASLGLRVLGWVFGIVVCRRSPKSVFFLMAPYALKPQPIPTFAKPTTHIPNHQQLRWLCGHRAGFRVEGSFDLQENEMKSWGLGFTRRRQGGATREDSACCGRKVNLNPNPTPRPKTLSLSKGQNMTPVGTHCLCHAHVFN